MKKGGLRSGLDTVLLRCLRRTQQQMESIGGHSCWPVCVVTALGRLWRYVS